MTAPADLYRGHRFPSDVISQVVWLYFRFSVSYREVEEMMARRGVQLTSGNGVTSSARISQKNFVAETRESWDRSGTSMKSS